MTPSDNSASSVTLHVTLEQLEHLTDALDFAYHWDDDTPMSDEAFADLYDKLVTAAGERTEGGD